MSKLQSTDEPTQYGQHSFPEELKKRLKMHLKLMHMIKLIHCKDDSIKKFKP